MYGNEVPALKPVQLIFGASAAPTVILKYCGQPVGIFVPSGFAGTTMTFENSPGVFPTNLSYANNMDSASETFYGASTLNTATAYSVTVAAGKYTPLDPVLTQGWFDVRITDAGDESAKTAAQRTIVVMVKARI